MPTMNSAYLVVRKGAQFGRVYELEPGKKFLLGRAESNAVVLDEGRVIEHGPLSRLLTAPASPITQGLLRDATATLWKPGGLA